MVQTLQTPVNPSLIIKQTKTPALVLSGSGGSF